MRSLLLAALLLLPAAAEAAQATVTRTGDLTSESRVERRDGADGNPWSVQKVLRSGDSTFNEAGLTLGVRYCYRHVNFNAFGDAAPSAEGCGKPGVPDPAGIMVIFAP